jgi:hypothetical protein
MLQLVASSPDTNSIREIVLSYRATGKTKKTKRLRVDRMLNGPA